jgi:hypothetical protein
MDEPLAAKDGEVQVMSFGQLLRAHPLKVAMIVPVDFLTHWVTSLVQPITFLTESLQYAILDLLLSFNVQH